MIRETLNGQLLGDRYGVIAIRTARPRGGNNYFLSGNLGPRLKIFYEIFEMQVTKT
jgi:hypothetical protein